MKDSKRCGPLRCAGGPLPGTRRHSNNNPVGQLQMGRDGLFIAGMPILRRLRSHVATRETPVGKRRWVAIRASEREAAVRASTLGLALMFALKACCRLLGVRPGIGIAAKGERRFDMPQASGVGSSAASVQQCWMLGWRSLVHSTPRDASRRTLTPTPLPRGEGLTAVSFSHWDHGPLFGGRCPEGADESPGEASFTQLRETLSRRTPHPNPSPGGERG